MLPVLDSQGFYPGIRGRKNEMFFGLQKLFNCCGNTFC
jgi:hypothetical protein